MNTNKIQLERERAKNYELPTIASAPHLVALTRNNVAKVEAMIRTDSNYRISLGDDYGSDEFSPYWIKKLEKYLKGESVVETIEDIVENIVKKLDKENSTHLNTDGVGLKQMPERILAHKETLLDDLKNRNFDLIKILSAKTIPLGGKHHGRENISFASKFCHYACFYIFEGQEAQDNFSIYDNVVAKALLEYLKFYNIYADIKKIKNKDYAVYSKAIDAVIEASGNEISRNGFDHLVWYYFKGRA
ncbi:MAG: hypothetical protein J5862_01865 [Bacteroidales bacterium]|nr:hypothetical protein [Bacteroidales bacterium]